MRNKNIETLMQKLKTVIEENNSRDLVENYENLLIAIDPKTKPNGSCRSADWIAQKVVQMIRI